VSEGRDGGSARVPSDGFAGDRRALFVRQVVLVLVVCVLAFWVRLGADGLSATEGHRAIPGWEMMASGEWVVPTLFGQAYLRKPPGMAWAVAGSSTIFGQTEFGARAVSAGSSTVLALLAFVFARRWFGGRYAAAAGVAFALTPWFWQAGRAAEIEALNNMFVAGAVFVLVDRLVFAAKSRAMDALGAVAAGLAIGGALLTKGPMGLVVVLGVVLGCCAVKRSAVPLLGLVVWGGVVIGAACFGVWYVLAAAYVERARIEPVTQSIGGFLWDSGRLVEILTLVPVGLAAGLPMSVSLAFVFGSSAASGAGMDDEPGKAVERSLDVARSLALGCVFSLALMTVLGIGNSRYAMPAVVFVTPCVAFGLRGWGRGWAGRFAPRRRAVARVLLLGHPVVSMSVMLVALGVWVLVIEPGRDARSGREAGVLLAEALPDGAVVLSDHLVEARPEVLWYAKRAARRDGKEVTMRWVPGLTERAGAFGDDALYLLRTDENEAERMETLGLLSGRRTLMTGEVHKYTFGLFGR
jgi:4-amino-4-deoxy-L-arabinose transferase-like glycosyltransferase